MTDLSKTHMLLRWLCKTRGVWQRCMLGWNKTGT